MNFKLVILPFVITLLSCGKKESVVESTVEKIPEKKIDFRQEMRDFVIGISKYAKTNKSNFLVVPQNGIELVTSNGCKSGQPQTDYLNAIDGNGQEDLFYGYDDDDKTTSTASNVYLRGLLNVSKGSGKTVLVTDYCSTPSKMTSSYSENAKNNYISFAANERSLNNIPKFPNSINQENKEIIT